MFVPVFGGFKTNTSRLYWHRFLQWVYGSLKAWSHSIRGSTLGYHRDQLNWLVSIYILWYHFLSIQSLLAILALFFDNSNIFLNGRSININTHIRRRLGWYWVHRTSWLAQNPLTCCAEKVEEFAFNLAWLWCQQIESFTQAILALNGLMVVIDAHVLWRKDLSYVEHILVTLLAFWVDRSLVEIKGFPSLISHWKHSLVEWQTIHSLFRPAFTPVSHFLFPDDSHFLHFHFLLGAIWSLLTHDFGVFRWVVGPLSRAEIQFLLSHGLISDASYIGWLLISLFFIIRQIWIGTSNRYKLFAFMSFNLLLHCPEFFLFHVELHPLIHHKLVLYFLPLRLNFRTITLTFFPSFRWRVRKFVSWAFGRFRYF